MLANVFREFAKPPTDARREEKIIITKNEVGETVILEEISRGKPHFGTRWLTPRKV